MHIAVLPWYQHREPVSVLGYELLPLALAVERGGPYSDSIRVATSYFFESQRRLTWNAKEPQLVPVSPGVILLPDGFEHRRLAAAIDGLFFATMIGNQPHRYANATNFVYFVQKIEREPRGEYGRQTRTLFGSRLVATSSDYSLETRPTWCGTAREPDEHALRLFEAVVDHPDAEPVRAATTALFGAMSDSAGTDPDTEQAEYARALERLLHRPHHRRRRRREEQQSVLFELIYSALDGVERCFDPDVLCSPIHSYGPYPVARATQWIRSARNSVWHPEVEERSPLMQQMAIRPNIVAFRAVSALLIASLAKLSPEHYTSRLKAYVAACTHWLGDIDELMVLDPETALNRFGDVEGFYLVREITIKDANARQHRG